MFVVCSSPYRGDYGAAENAPEHDLQRNPQSKLLHALLILRPDLGGCPDRMSSHVENFQKWAIILSYGDLCGSECLMLGVLGFGSLENDASALGPLTSLLVKVNRILPQKPACRMAGNEGLRVSVRQMFVINLITAVFPSLSSPSSSSSSPYCGSCYCTNYQYHSYSCLPSNHQPESGPATSTSKRRGPVSPTSRSDWIPSVDLPKLT